MIKYHNGEMYVIPKEFEKEVRAEEKAKLNQILTDIKSTAEKLIYHPYNEKDEYYNYGVESVLNIIAKYEKEINNDNS